MALDHPGVQFDAQLLQPLDGPGRDHARAEVAPCVAPAVKRLRLDQHHPHVCSRRFGFIEKADGTEAPRRPSTDYHYFHLSSQRIRMAVRLSSICTPALNTSKKAWFAQIRLIGNYYHIIMI